jgi:hypothetical protein
MAAAKIGLLLLCLCALGCVDDDDRCGEGYQQVNIDGAVGILPSTVCSRLVDAGDGLGTVTEGGLPTGLGDECSKPEDCEGKEASFCANFPFPGLTPICTVEGCSRTDDNCPGDYVCCDALIKQICLPPGIYADLKARKICA